MRGSCVARIFLGGSLERASLFLQHSPAIYFSFSCCLPSDYLLQAKKLIDESTASWSSSQACNGKNWSQITAFWGLMERFTLRAIRCFWLSYLYVQFSFRCQFTHITCSHSHAKTGKIRYIPSGWRRKKHIDKLCPYTDGRLWERKLYVANKTHQ